jgi:hypothetical protein
MRKTGLPNWLWAFLVAAVGLSAVSVWQRHRVEAANKTVGMAVEFETVDSLASAQGKDLTEALKNLKAQGLTHVVLGEETLADMLAESRVSVRSEGGRFLFTGDRGALASLAYGLTVRYPNSEPLFQDGESQLSVGGDVPSLSVLRGTAVGLNIRAAETLGIAGLPIVARHSNPSGINSKGVTATLLWSHGRGATVFLPQGDQVLGRRDSLKATDEALRRLEMLYASPEFGRIGGDASMVERSPGNVVRLHSAQVAELDRLTLPDAVERYARAARERNNRLLLVRPLTASSDKPLDAFADFLRRINLAVRKEGGSIGLPRPFAEPDLPAWVPIALSVAALGVAAGLAIAILPANAAWLGLVPLGLLAVGSFREIGLQVSALLASLTFPLLGFWLLERLRPRNPVVGFLMVSALSVLGGVVVAGMLNGLDFYVKASEFRGIKVSVFFPLLVAGGLFYVRLTDWKKGIDTAITWRAALTLIAVAGVLGFMILRTGNEGGGASPTELALRNLLDRVLWVRPRTKEFLIGHPVLIVACGLLVRWSAAPENRRAWIAFFMMLGAVGQTSIVNTLCHLHIPAAVSLGRIALGIVLGCILGTLLWILVKRWVPEHVGENEIAA